jgi:phage N-6-adenine-methyltransferase
MNNVHFTSNSDEWETPQYVFDHYNSIYDFTLDACANKSNYKVGIYQTKEADELPWNNQIVWCNPPYSELKKWIEKAYYEATVHNATVVMLIPARTDTISWHKHVAKGDVTFLKGRLKFSNSKNSAPFPSAIVVFSRHILHNTKGSSQYLDVKEISK